MNTGSVWRANAVGSALLWLNAGVSFASYIVFPELLLEWKERFGIGLALTLLTSSSVLSRVAGALAYSRLSMHSRAWFQTSILSLAALGTFGFTSGAEFGLQLASVWAVGLAHGLWTAALQEHIVRSTPSPEDAARASSRVQFLSNVGVALGGLANAYLVKEFGFAVATYVAAALFLALSLATSCTIKMPRANLAKSDSAKLDTTSVDSPRASPGRNEETSSGSTPWLRLLPAGGGVFLLLLAYSSLNFLVPLRARAIDSAMPIGTFFTLNAFVVIGAQPVFTRLRTLHVPKRALRVAIGFLLAGITALAPPMQSVAALIAFVVFLSLAEVLLFPAFGGLAKALVLERTLPANKVSSLYTGVRVLGLGGGSVAWPLIASAGGVVSMAFGLTAVVVGCVCLESLGRSQNS